MSTDAPRKILHAMLSIPVQPGPLTLVYPQWIPGEHGPTGPIDNLAGLVISRQWTATRLEARRREHVRLSPHGARRSIVARRQTRLPRHSRGHGLFCRSLDHAPTLPWSAGMKFSSIPPVIPPPTSPFRPRPNCPPAGNTAPRLPKQANPNGTVQFETVSLEQLVDSPLLAGKYFKEFPLAPEVTPKHYPRCRRRRARRICASSPKRSTPTAI